jgi:hypothetical protein
MATTTATLPRGRVIIKEGCHGKPTTVGARFQFRTNFRFIVRKNCFRKITQVDDLRIFTMNECRELHNNRTEDYNKYFHDGNICAGKADTSDISIVSVLWKGIIIETFVCSVLPRLANTGYVFK